MAVPDIDYEDVRRQIYSFMRSIPFPPIENKPIELDGKKHRFKIDGDKHSETSGEYKFYTDGVPAGYALSYRSGECINWSYQFPQSGDFKLSKKQLREFHQQALAQRKERAAKIEQEQKEHSAEAEKIFNLAQPVTKSTQHPYLQDKQITGSNAHIDSNNNLLIPIRDIDGHFLTIQTIDTDGHKKFFYGAPIRGGFCKFDAVDTDTNIDTPILICEGYATARSIHEVTTGVFMVVAAMNCHNLIKVAHDFRTQYPVRKIFILADNDSETEKKTGKNPGIDAAKEAVNSGFADWYIAPEFKMPRKPFDDETQEEYQKAVHVTQAQIQLIRTGTDWNDFLRAYGKEFTADTLEDKFRYGLMSKRERELASKVKIINAQDLTKKEFMPLKWAVDGLLPAGLAILGGQPKVGKSILALNLALSITIGGVALGKIKVKQGSVLYLALEDPERRLQGRITNTNISGVDSSDDLSRLDIVTQIPRQHEGGLDFINWWLDAHQDARLVIIDTLQKFRKLLSGRNDRYSEDYDALSDIKKLADKHDVTILVIHHLKKGLDPTDWVNNYSGSMGISGTADTLLQMARARTHDGGILHRTGRDVEEKDFGLKLDGFCWILSDNPEEFTQPKWKRDILDYVREHGETTPIQLSKDFDISLETAQQNLHRLFREGLLRKVRRGVYDMKDI